MDDMTAYRLGRAAFMGDYEGFIRHGGGDALWNSPVCKDIRARGERWHKARAA